MTDTNLLTERAEGFDAYVQFQTGSDYYRLKGIQQVQVQYQWSDEDRYSDDGVLARIRTGQQHTASIGLVLTKSEGDTASPPTNTKTISYWIAQREAGNRVEMLVVQVFTTKAASSKYLRHRFTMDIDSIMILRQAAGSAIDLTVSGRIISATTPTFKQESS
jgi:hypothetical protein